MSLQRFSTGHAEPFAIPSIVHDVLRSPGRPLDAETRAFFEPRFGHEFSQVRLHADARAAESARAVQAHAYTVGRDVVFGAAQYAPGTGAGNRLLAHELTHVVQQSGGRGCLAPLRVDESDSPAEREADQIARAVISHRPGSRPASLLAPRIQRQRAIPNRAPSCDQICGDPAHCIRGPGEQCSTTMDKIIGDAWKKAAQNLTTAINHIDNTPGSHVLSVSLRANFNWSSGNSPHDLPAKVRKVLGDAYTKFSDNLCTKCRPCPSPQTRVHIEQARGRNCLAYNCFVICPTFNATDGPHALLHELLHRVVPPGGVQDLYRGQAGYPGYPSFALKMPDTYASLVDDLVASSAPPPAHGGHSSGSHKHP
jgi:Domain of unknown function (DUF4157)